jgi:large subunit ribosomal protein L11
MKQSDHHTEEIPMAKEIGTYIKLQVKGGAANPAPPIGPALGAKGCKHHGILQAVQCSYAGTTWKSLPVIITVYTDKSFDFVIKRPPAAVQIMDLAKI